MDVVKALGELYQEKKRLDVAIANLEARQSRNGDRPGKRPGRKSMSAEERRAVSQRMAGYWAARKAVHGPKPAISELPESLPETRSDQDYLSRSQ